MCGAFLFILNLSIMIYRRLFSKPIVLATLFMFSCSKNSPKTSFDKINYKKPSVSFADFIGSNQCQSCHPDIYEQWKGSTHAMAGGPATPENIIAPFNGNPITLKDAIVYPEKVNSTYQFRITELNGDLRQIVAVEAVVGKGMMYGGGTQTFFGKYDDGTYRFLPFDYSKHEATWFVQLRKDEKWVKIDPQLYLDDLYNWPPHRTLGEIDDISNCQQCHGSQIIAKKIDDVYDVKFTSLSINCESCHGPAKNHATIMSNIVQNVVNEYQTIGIESAVGISTNESLNMCFQCHAVKTPIKNNYLPGENLEEFYSLKLPLLGNENPFSINGRIKTFGYQLNHLFSDCFLSGSMDCTSCHNPHSNDYQDISKNALIGRFDDNQCLSCHVTKTSDIAAHTYHKPESEGSSCIACHMPARQHLAIGTEIKYTRADHTVSIPRPSFDSSQGFESACKQCHADISDQDLQLTVNDWYGTIKPLHPVIANRMKINERTTGADAAKALLQPSHEHPMGQFANLSYFIKRYLSPGMSYLDLQIIEKLIDYTEHDDLDVKALAYAGLHYSQHNNPQVKRFLVSEINKLGLKEEPVRRRWGLILDYFGSVFFLSGDKAKAIECYELASEILPDDATIINNLSKARS